jgi:hypothetical protein
MLPYNYLLSSLVVWLVKEEIYIVEQKLLL